MFNNETPFVTVVITNYNRQKIIVPSITSALNEFNSVIVVDDCSTDNSYAFISHKFSEEIGLGKLALYKLEKNYGVTGAKNYGYSKSRSKWVIFLDSDDQIINGAGAAVCHALKIHNTRPIVFFRCVDQSGNFVGRLSGMESELTLSDYCKNLSYGEALTAIHKDIVQELVPYDTELRGYEALGCARIIDLFGSAQLSAVIARVYNQESDDRLSISSGFWKRANLISIGHLRMLKLYRSNMSISVACMYAFKSFCYLIASRFHR